MTGSLKPTHWIILTICVALAGFIAWAHWATLDQVTRAPGRVVPFARVQIVQSEEGGAIAAIHVREGDAVKAGELLVELDTAGTGAAAQEARDRHAALAARMARIEAELFDRAPAFPAVLADYPEFVAGQRRLYERRRAALAAELAALGAMARLQREELALGRPLVETGDVARSELIRLERGIAETEGRAAALRARHLAELQAEFTRTQEELAAAEQQLASRENSLEATYLLAPADGIVKNVRLTTLGGVLAPGDEVLQIVPTGEKLIVEAQVPPRDIAFVELGQRARINFDAYDPAVYGSAEGRVVSIGPDTLTDQRGEGAGASYYRVALEVDTAPMRTRTGAIVLQPGMTATAEILTGETTVWRYLTKPILKTTSKAMRER